MPIAPSTSPGSVIVREPQVSVVNIDAPLYSIQSISWSPDESGDTVQASSTSQNMNPAPNMKLADYLASRYTKTFCERIMNVVETRQSLTFNVEAADRKNESAASEIRLTPLEKADPPGQILVTEVYEDALSHSQDLLREAQLFLESAPDATFIFDDTGHLVLTNREAEQLFGYSRSELMAMSIEELMPERYRKGHQLHRKRFTANPTVREMGAGMMISALTRSGTEVPVDIRLGPIVSNEQLYFSASVRNVQTRVDNEQQLELARDTAEQATAEKSRFLAAASHDLRQPLQAISLYLSVLGRTQDPDVRTEVQDKIQRSLDNVSGMLEALLDVSRFESGKVAPRKTRVELSRLLGEIAGDTTEQAINKGLSFNYADTNTVLYTDPLLLKRVLENFLCNAIRYTETGSIELTVEKRETTAVVGVQDTGIGIEKSELNRIFEEYYTLGNPMRNRSKGLGLGLAIVKHIAKLLDHKVSAQSVAGKGSLFSIEVPLDTSDSENKGPDNTAASGEDTAAASLKILLVDDDDDIRDSAHLLFSEMSMEVCSARTAESALDVVAAGFNPHAIVSDYRLPGMNGLEMIRRLRKTLRYSPYALVTTGDTGSTELKRLSAEECEVVYKPIDAMQLMERVRSGVATKKGPP